jgi:hypothetical protein
MTDVDWNFQLAQQLDWHWREQLRPRLNGLLHHGAEIALLRDLYRWHFDGKGA